MHELSIAHSLVEVAASAARDAGARRVTAVHLRLGALAGVVRAALDFCYDVASRGTLLEGSRLIVHDVPVVVYCPGCRVETTLQSIQRFRCPQCDTPTADIRKGKELQIESIEIES